MKTLRIKKETLRVLTPEEQTRIGGAIVLTHNTVCCSDNCSDNCTIKASRPYCCA